MNLKIKNTKGVTLVEVLVTAMIGAVVAAAVVVFVNISGTATDQMAGLQVLQQESSMISERFLRIARGGTTKNGKGVYKVDGGGGLTLPGDNILDADHIRIPYTNSSNDIDLKISGNTLEMIKADGSKSNLSTRLCTAKGPGTLSTFNIMPFGEGVRLILTLEYTRKDKIHTYTTTIGSVRCKN